jgi:hypothetical protein
MLLYLLFKLIVIDINEVILKYIKIYYSAFGCNYTGTINISGVRVRFNSGLPTFNYTNYQSVK